MENVLTRKLERLSPFDADDRKLLASIVAPSKVIPADRDIIREGEVPADVHLITSGIACRYKILLNGTRQIFAVLLPGDFCDLHVFILDAMDHCIGTLSQCTIVDIPRDAILRLTERPAIARALWWVTLVDESTLREALVNMGRRRATERVAHFICEMLARLDAVNLVHDHSFDLPITQVELGDTLGLSFVHINRVMQFLRVRKFISFDRGRLSVLNVGGLKALGGFDPNYLHLGRRGTRLDIGVQQPVLKHP